MATQTRHIAIEVYTVDQFCVAHGISRRHFYTLKAEGKAPRTVQIERSVRISHEAAADWRREREAESAARKSEAAA
jgi:predicted DNA-binding transcriptional regulator AlpA